nr:zinc finger protein RFP-like [Pogona vitticeps]
MASESPWRKLLSEATCPSCLEYFTDPMILDCGHNLCFPCLAYLWNDFPTTARCPRCATAISPKNFKVNLQLANMVEIAKELKPETREEGRCLHHGEPLKLFCKDDKAPICVVCDKAVEHREHKVVPVKEAAQEYKTWKHLETLKKELDNMLASKRQTEKESQDLLKQMKAVREKMRHEFGQLHQFLIEQEKRLLVRMEEAEEEIAGKRDEHLAKLSEELASLESFLQEMEEKQKEPGSEILQDVGNFLLRRQRRKLNPVAFPPELKWLIWDICDINPFLEGVMRPFKDTLVSGLHQQKVNVHLDPLTANHWLIVSEDCKSVREGSECQSLPDTPERFDMCGLVLGCEEFTTGRHFWDVGVSSEEQWSVGVAKKSLNRKGDPTFGSEEGVWEFGKWGGKYRAYDPPANTVLSLGEKPSRIRVALNYEGRRVAFYDADRGAFLYAFTAATFSGETVQPWFYVTEKAHLVISP